MGSYPHYMYSTTRKYVTTSYLASDKTRGVNLLLSSTWNKASTQLPRKRLHVTSDDVVKFILQEHHYFQALVLQSASIETNSNLQMKNLNESDEKPMVKMFIIKLLNMSDSF